MDKLNTKYWFSTMKENEEENYEDHIETIVRRVEMPIRAVLGKSVVTVSDFVGLQNGDIIKLNSKIGQELDIFVGNLKKFKARPGSSKESYAVRVTTILREEE